MLLADLHGNRHELSSDLFFTYCNQVLSNITLYLRDLINLINII